MRGTLERLPELRALHSSQMRPRWSRVLTDFNPCAEELALLEAALADDPPATLQNTGVIRPGYSAELDGVIERSRHAREWIANLEAVERERTGIKTLKVGYNKVFGYYIEITRANSERRRTTTSASRPWSMPSATSRRR